MAKTLHWLNIALVDVFGVTMVDWEQSIHLKLATLVCYSSRQWTKQSSTNADDGVSHDFQKASVQTSLSPAIALTTHTCTNIHKEANWG